MQIENFGLVTCSTESNIMTISLDDGKSNVISPDMIAQINRALDQAERSKCVVILTGRGDIFSAGFDLKILKTGVLNTFKMLIGGFQLSRRLLSFPLPVIIACNGHAMAMGAFLVLSGDYRIGVVGQTKIAANEVEIGLTMPYSAVEICRQRLTGMHFNRAVLLSEYFAPEAAVEAGFLDEIVAPDQLMPIALERARKYAALDLEAHRLSKQRTRRELIKAMNKAIRADKLDFVVKGLKRVMGK